MAKKQRRATPKPTPTRRQLSRWQRQQKMRRIVIIAAAVFLAAIVIWAGVGYYTDRVAPWREVVIRVNDAEFTMGYYVDMLDMDTRAMEPDWVYYRTRTVASIIVNSEVARQYAYKDLGIQISEQEIDAKLAEQEWPDSEVVRSVARSMLLDERLSEHFDGEVPVDMQHARVQVVLVEDEAAADEVTAEIRLGGNFTALVEEFGYHPQIKGDLGWLPQELMPNPLVKEAAFNMTPGDVSEPIYDEGALKSVGYWLIEVVDAFDDGDEEKEIKVRGILLGTRAEAEKVREELVGGNFTALAKKYSQHESAEKGGEIGWRKPGEMGSAAFDAVAFDLPMNEVSEPVKDESVQTSGGFWIVEVLDQDERELEEEHREALVRIRMDGWFDEQKEKCTIKVLSDERMRWAAAEVLRRR